MIPLDAFLWSSIGPWLCLGVGYLIFVVIVLLARRAPRDSRYCVSCSYDLTGNTSGRCPECGAEIRR